MIEVICNLLKWCQTSRGFLFQIGSEESALWFGKNKKAEYLGRCPERQLEMLKVSISIKSNMVNSNRFWVELSNEKNKFNNNQANIYLFKFNSRNTRKSCEISSKLTIKIPEQCQCFSGVLLMHLNLFHTFFYCFHCWPWTGKCFPEI